MRTGTPCKSSWQGGRVLGPFPTKVPWQNACRLVLKRQTTAAQCSGHALVARVPPVLVTGAHISRRAHTTDRLTRVGLPNPAAPTRGRTAGLRSAPETRGQEFEGDRWPRSGQPAERAWRATEEPRPNTFSVKPPRSIPEGKNIVVSSAQHAGASCSYSCARPCDALHAMCHDVSGYTRDLACNTACNVCRAAASGIRGMAWGDEGRLVRSGEAGVRPWISTLRRTRPLPRRAAGGRPYGACSR
jgi:hypothetical protein